MEIDEENKLIKNSFIFKIDEYLSKNDYFSVDRFNSRFLVKYYINIFIEIAYLNHWSTFMYIDIRNQIIYVNELLRVHIKISFDIENKLCEIIIYLNRTIEFDNYEIKLCDSEIKKKMVKILQDIKKFTCDVNKN